VLVPETRSSPGSNGWAACLTARGSRIAESLTGTQGE
jgi:hypothetical protein